MERRFQTVLVSEPTVEDTIAILRGLKEKYEIHHGVRITDGAIVSAAELSDRYITDRFLPDKAIDLMDEAASRLRIEIDSMPEEVDAAVVDEMEFQQGLRGRQKMVHDHPFQRERPFQELVERDERFPDVRHGQNPCGLVKKNTILIRIRHIILHIGL